MPQYSPQYYEEKMAAANAKYLDALSELREYRKEVKILIDSKEEIYQTLICLNLNKNQINVIDDNLKAIANLVSTDGNEIPGFERFLSMDSELGYKKTFSACNEDYYSDLVDVIDEIDEILDEFGEIMFNLRGKVTSYAYEVNSWRQAYCNDYGMTYSPTYTEEDYNR